MQLRYIKPSWGRAWMLIFLIAVFGCELALADTRLDAADRSYRAGRYVQAGKLYRDLAESGDPQAQFRLGMLHYLGRGVREDERQAFDWFQRAAKAGNIDAQYRLATLYTLRQGLPADTDDADIEAARWYFSAAARGHAEAQYALALMFITGKGVEQSPEEAEKWMRRAAAQGLEGARSFGSTKSPPPPPKK